MNLLCLSLLVLTSVPARPAWLGAGPVNRGGAAGLHAAMAQVTRVEVRRVATGRIEAVLGPADRARLKQLVGKGAVSDTPAAAPPPWPVVLVFRTRARGAFVAFLVGHERLRVNPADPLSARITGPGGATPQVAEVALEDPDLWLWKYLEGRLGPTRVKEYQVADAPASLRSLPPPPPVAPARAP